jgi:hypothetical protein
MWRSRFEFAAAGVKVRLQIITFCSGDLTSLVCQQIAVDVDGAARLGLKSIVDARHVDGERCVISGIRLEKSIRPVTVRRSGKARVAYRLVALPTSPN